MRIPINWLKEYVDMKLSVKELSDKLTMSGTENEILENSGNFDGIVVGEILEIHKHPNADKLQVTKTSVGKDVLQIVCGAPNIEVGQKVPVALVGTQIGEFEIKEAELRGEKSYGMLCSESELGISDDHSGIMILDPRAKAGDSLANALNIGETVLEAEITPNRGDCLSMIGIAREVAVVTGQDLKLPVSKIQEAKERVFDMLSVEIKDKELCRRYMARIIKNVKIGDSPKWMQERLSSSGVRPINTVVDVTNYVMLEMGQPLHAFDAEKISGGKIIVRKAEKGEKIETLDGVSRELDINDLVIADAQKAVALAGVMGGASSEVRKNTTTIVLESANFHPTSIRKTALRLALRSESSARFEKGLSLKLTSEALERAAALLAEVSDGKILAGKIDEGERNDKEKRVTLRFEKLKTFLGQDIQAKDAVGILERLGFEVKGKNKEGAETSVPHWRLDASIEEDLLEEIARIYGYENIPSTLPQGQMPVYEKNEKIEVSKKIREVLTAIGFFETYSYSFTNQEKANLLKKEDKLVKIANPLSQEQEYMRTDLLGSMLDVASKNKDVSVIKIYELASIYIEKGETQKLSILVAGKDEDESFQIAKGAMDLMFSRLNIENIHYKEGAVFSKNEQLGLFVIKGSETLNKFKIKSKAACFVELDLMTLSKLMVSKKFTNIPKFPGSQRDLTFELDEEVLVNDVYVKIDEIKSPIRTKSEVIDVYRGKGLALDKKSVSIRFTYQAMDRTLTDKEVDEDQSKIVSQIKTKLGGILRGEEQ